MEDIYSKAKKELESQQSTTEVADEYAQFRNIGNDSDENINSDTYVDIDNKSIQHDEVINNNPITGVELEEDNPIFQGGPRVSQIELWKKQYTNVISGYVMGKVFVVKLPDESMYVLRTLRRGEYLQIMALQNSNEFSREEIIAHECCLFPRLEYEDMHLLEGGIPSVIAQIVMENSAFTKDYSIQVL